jgi:hypothetical protein
MTYQIDELGNLTVIETESYTKELPEMYLDANGQLRAGKKKQTLETTAVS